MKIDEVLKRLESIKTDEKDERYEIAKYITQILGVDKSLNIYYIMTKYMKIYEFDSYRHRFKIDEISPDDAYVYIETHYLIGYEPIQYFYPFLDSKYLLLYAYLSKQGLEDNFYRVVPAPRLKYISKVIRLPHGKQRMIVEVVDIHNAAFNTNLPTLTRGILGTKQIDNDMINKVLLQLSSQKLFAGYDFNKARDIINRYYAFQETSLAKEVESIKYAYNQIFKPFRIIYDLETKQFIKIGG